MPSTAVPLTEDQKLTAYLVRIARDAAEDAEHRGLVDAAAWWTKRAAEIEAAEKAKGAR